MSVNRSPLLREIFQISYQGQCEKHFLICLQSNGLHHKFRNNFWELWYCGRKFLILRKVAPTMWHLMVFGLAALNGI